MSKGGDNEREVCRLLTEWVTGQRDPVIFWRTGGSGGQATAAHKRGVDSNMFADIMSIKTEGDFFTELFSVETKWYKKFSLDNLLVVPEGIEQYVGGKATERKSKGKTRIVTLHIENVLVWWEQCKRDASRSGKEPYMILRKNNMPYYLFMRAPVADLLGLTEYRHVAFTDMKQQRCIVCLFDTFLKHVQPNRLKLKYGQIQKQTRLSPVCAA